MKLNYTLWVLVTFFIVQSCIAKELPAVSDQSYRNGRIHVPMGGNAFVRPGGKAQLTTKGLVAWESPSDIIDTYVRFSKTGKVKLLLNAIVQGKSQVRISLGGQVQLIDLQKGGDGYCAAGEWAIVDTGYVKITLQGMSKTGRTFAEVHTMVLEGEAISPETKYVENNTGDYYYWGRRGPSVHLNYTVPEAPIEWFYNEVTVPQGQDVVGSYFMANGFAEGYFGMQVNSESERRILFSVWSPFQTDDPQAIPVEKRIVLESKGSGVYTGEFGNEGSGGQSYLKYNWVAGNTYRFLLRGVPSGDSTTTYTAYFYAPESQQWALIASFKRPQTDTHLKRLHSFLENFIPEKGDIERQVSFGNQWVRSVAGQWTALTQAKFTADATARKGYRMDFAGGTLQQVFFLKNCGFFNGYTPINTYFDRGATGVVPVLDLEAISRLSEGDAKRP